ncbi:glycosyltransferase family 4 protein [Enterovibrio makurazakiensis]|uniref:glycosyltransferase family 4 protein n=1 Tax=Enterovibrio makurazakiensis TaxID=2910232 RepID=UPI003D2203C9
MHILFLTDNFPPEGNAPATRTYEHAKRWVETGHKVTVITCAPNFPEGVVYQGYKNHWYHRSAIEGIDVIRVKTFITANEGTMKRILDYVSFMASSFVAGLFQSKIDVVVATSPQFFTACSGWALAACRRKPYVFELRDIWPASITAVGAMQNSRLISVLEKLELFLYSRADSIISVTYAFKDELIQRGVSGEKIDVVRNGVDLTKYSPANEKDSEFARKYGLKNKFVVGYIGTHGMAQGLDSIVSVAEALKHETNIQFVFAGGGSERKMVESLVAEKGLDNVTLIERQPKEAMPRIWSLCDVALIPLINKELFKTVIPSKIFECMAMGIPMIASLPEGEATKIIRETKSGIISRCCDVSSIRMSILELLNDKDKYNEIKMSGIKGAHEFSRVNQADLMIEYIEKIAFD